MRDSNAGLLDGTTGFGPDFSNLCRYVKNGPTNAIDPTGGVEVPIGPGHSGVIDVSGCDPKDRDRIAVIQRAVCRSCSCIENAIDLLANYYDGVKKFYANSVLDGRKLLNQADRDRVLALLRNVKQECEKRIPIKCDSKNSGSERLAYVNFLTGTNVVIGSVIHVCPLYFSADVDEQNVAILHEFGRFYNGLGETNTGTWKDAYVWDNIVNSLCDNFNEIRELSSKNVGPIR
jgi:hypothetical protein